MFDELRRLVLEKRLPKPAEKEAPREAPKIVPPPADAADKSAAKRKRA